MVFTDHGDGTRPPDPPTYRAGVLCLDAVEISTDDGHLIALGLPAAPYPLAGEARDVLEDVHRLGGIGIAAHPDSPRPSLQWRDWRLPIDGFELVNLDTVWRQQVATGGWRRVTRVARSLSTYLVRPSETMAALVTTSDELAARWVAIARARQLAMFAGVDAHARLELWNGDQDGNRWALAFPGYEALFKTLTMRVRPEQSLSGDAAADGRQVLDALRRGRAYASLDGVLSPPTFEFTASTGSQTLRPGDAAEAAGPLQLSVTTNAPATFTTIVWRDGEVLLRQAASPRVTIDAPAGPALYRAEIRANIGDTERPWLMSNGILIRPPSFDSPSGPDRVSSPASRRNPSGVASDLDGAKAKVPRVLFDSQRNIGWLTESSSDSKIATEVVPTVAGREMHTRFGLPGGDVYGQFVALVANLNDGALLAARRLRFTARSDQPMRISLQLRVPGSGDGLRWRRSVYVDPEPRTFELALDEFRAVAGATPAEAPLGDVRTLLFVIDQTNARPGTAGHLWLRDISVY